MTLFNFLFFVGLVLILAGVLVLNTTTVPYFGVVALMSVVALCSFVMVVMGRMFMALVVLVVYLGGMMIIFGYCVSVEKDLESGYWSIGFKVVSYLFVFVVVAICLWSIMVSGIEKWFVVLGWDSCYVNLEVNGFGVLYFSGYFGLVVCLWGLLMTLFSILVVLRWGSYGGLRPF
uniref:NADH-ubiquinone oxidoreductase chain 6 n=1 Tax=Anilius scytale TaxID=51844 RepID=D2W925_ANISC|nr:NADH dehydrogenase subunit 6 [Anilius scytale]